MTVAYETNCAGQGCEEADRCRRFRLRMPSADLMETHGIDLKLFDWASFDIERKQFGDCVNFIKYHEKRPHAAR